MVTMNIEGAINAVNKLTADSQSELNGMYNNAVQNLEMTGQGMQSTQMNPANNSVRDNFKAKTDALNAALQSFCDSLSTTDKAFDAQDLESLSSINSSNSVLEGVATNDLTARLGQ